MTVRTLCEKALDFLSLLQLETGEKWGEAATESEWRDVQTILEPQEVRRFWISKAKGWRKTLNAAAMTLAAMRTQLAPRAQCYVAARDAGQANLLIQSIQSLVICTPGLEETYSIQFRGNGVSRVIDKISGVEMVVYPFDQAGSHGLRPDWMILDELSWWPEGLAEEMFLNLTTGLAKVPGSRLMILSAGGAQDHWSHWHYEIARNDPAWMLFEESGPPPWLPEAEIETERRRLPSGKFRQLWLNQWTLDDDDALLDPEDVEACRVADRKLVEPKAGRVYCIGVDLGIWEDPAAVVVAHNEPVEEQVHAGNYVTDGRKVVVDCVRTWIPNKKKNRPVPIKEVEEFVTSAHLRYNRASIYCDPTELRSWVQDLRADGIPIVEVSNSPAHIDARTTEVRELLTNRMVELPDDDHFVAEFKSVLGKPGGRPGFWRIDHKRRRHDDQVQAFGLASVPLREMPVGKAPRRVIASITDRYGNVEYIYDEEEAPPDHLCEYNQNTWRMLQELRNAGGPLRGRR